jgi:hypothetical protein
MASKNRWLMPTNTENLKMIIAQGLISSPNGFKKYYSDVLELFTGYIPLFRNRIQPDILNSVVSEVEGLTACIIEFDLNKIEGLAKTISNSQLIDVPLKDIDTENYDLLLLLAPIPLSCISKIIFKTDADKKAFENDAKLYSNVPISTLKLHYTKLDQKLFEAKPEVTNYQISQSKSIDFNATDNIEYNKIYAFGGMLANMFYFSKNGTKSNEVFLSCASYKEIDEYEDLSYIVDYFNNPEKSESNNHLYNSIVDVAVRSKDFKDEIIDFLESDSKTVNIANKLKNFEAISDKPVSEEFSDAKTLLGKVLLMLFYREDTESLMEYSLDIFTEEDYLTFAAMFGIRDKFIKIPKFLREFENLQNFISVKMANYAHKTLESKLKFKEQKKPLTIIEMLKNNRFKEYFTKELSIENCFQTVISKSDYHVVKGKLIFEGIVIPKFELLEEKYFKFMSQEIFKEYNKYLDKYNKVK